MKYFLLTIFAGHYSGFFVQPLVSRPMTHGCEILEFVNIIGVASFTKNIVQKNRLLDAPLDLFNLKFHPEVLRCNSRVHVDPPFVPLYPGSHPQAESSQFALK